jgi:hypothetical protein
MPEPDLPLGWSGDPGPVIDHLVVFGPATRDVIE